MAKKKAVKKTVKPVTAEAEVKPAEVKAEPKEIKATVKKAAPKKAAPKVTAAKKAEPKTKCIFKAIETGDFASFTALLPAQKNSRTQVGRTPLMEVCLILSNPRLTDGSNYETHRNVKNISVYEKMKQALLDAKCDLNAMDIAGNTARDYLYGGFLNTMLAD